MSKCSDCRSASRTTSEYSWLACVDDPGTAIDIVGTLVRLFVLWSEPTTDYVRRRACEAVLAGFHDALDYLERQDQGQLIHAAAKNLRKRIHDLPHNGGNGNGGNGGNGGHGPGNGGQHGHAPAGGTTAALPPPSGKPNPAPQQQPLPGIDHPAPQIGQTSTPAQPPRQQSRKAGRPRKEVHG